MDIEQYVIRFALFVASLLYTLCYLYSIIAGKSNTQHQFQCLPAGPYEIAGTPAEIPSVFPFTFSGVVFIVRLVGV